MMAEFCTTDYEREMADEYLVVLGGGDTDSPTGFVCGIADIKQWRFAILRLRRALANIVKANPGIPIPSASEGVSLEENKLRQRLASWLAASTKLPSGSFVHLFGTLGVCEDDVARMVDFGQQGTRILAHLACVYNRKGGKIPAPPVQSTAIDEGLPGPDIVWYVGIILLAIIAYKATR